MLEITQPVYASGITYNNTLIPKSNVCLVYFCVGFNNTNFQALFKHHKIQRWKTQHNNHIA